jgi:hypothetical protein
MIHRFVQILMVMEDEILLFIEIGLENGLSYHIEYHHFLLRINGVVRLIYQLVEIMMEMDEVTDMIKFEFEIF